MVQEEDKLSKPVTLKKIKNYKLFKEFSPIKQSQLSIVEIDTKYWKKTCKMSNMG
jgi:predicted RNA-binding protein with PUA-like domain|tara:strand:- start:58 stop:222 length:165 start_codon:yes stop_codon:yes gene_type:complete